MNVEEYIKSLVPSNSEEKYLPNFCGMLLPNQSHIDILDWQYLPDTIFSEFNNRIKYIDNGGALFMIGGLPLVYQLVKLRFPILIAEEDRNVSVVLPYDKRKDYHLDISVIKKMNHENYWAYLELWNRQGNRNFICAPKLLHHILWNRFNPDKVKMYN